MRSVKNPKSPPPIMPATPRSAGHSGGASTTWVQGWKDKPLKASRFFRALPLMLVVTTIMFLVFSAVLHQPSRPADAPARISGKSSGFHYQYHIAKVEDLVPAVLRGTAHSSERLAKEARGRTAAAKPDPPPVPAPQHEDEQAPESEAGERSEGQEAEGRGQAAAVKRSASGRVLIFTMDSISAYEERSRKGGAAGEITIRRSLESGLSEMGLQVEVARSDEEFAAKHMHDYRLIILDSWTWAAPGWEPKPFLRGHEDRIFLLDFFGAPTPMKNGIKVPPERILTAFDTTPWNTFLGYYVSEGEEEPQPPVQKKAQGVIWGKDPRHYRGKESVLRDVAELADLYSTLTVNKGAKPPVEHPRIHYVGHQSSEGWRQLLAESKFLLGLGDPLLGPSAMDAVAMGCVYINPRYDEAVKGIYHSQHQYAEEHVGRPYVCTVRLDDREALRACVQEALAVSLPPMVPQQLTRQAYMARLWDIFGPFVEEGEEEDSAAEPAGEEESAQA